MRGKVKIAALFLSVLLAFCLIGCGGAEKDPPVEPPAPVAKVQSVTLQYNGENVGGTLSVDLSAGTVQLGAVVKKDEGADGAVTYASSVTDVATVGDKGLVTLKAQGETVISAAAGDKKHEIVLVVGDDYAPVPESYTVTVNGGTADATAAAAGEPVTLTPVIPPHMRFVKWVFKVGGAVADDLWVNGSVFKMPGSAVEIVAEYEDMLYTLNVVGAKVVGADGTTLEGEDGGNIKDGELAEYDMTVYNFVYETPVSLEAIDAPEGKIFVGWDYGSKNNRSGEKGVPELAFAMPDETTTVWAVFSPFTNKIFTGGVGGFAGQVYLENGAPDNDPAAVDPDLEGMSGRRITILGGTGASTSFPENIQGSKFNTVRGSQTIKTIFKNHHETLSVTVELYITYYGNWVQSGLITVPAGEKVTHFFEAGLGIDDPWWGIQVRDNVGGTSSDRITLDVVAGCAPTYPEGDPKMQMSDIPEYVRLGSYTAGGSWPAGRPKIQEKEIGMSAIAVYGGNFGGQANGYLSAPIENMPAFDPAAPTQTVYVRITNNVTNTSEPTTTLEFAVGTAPNPTAGGAGAKLVSETIRITKIGEAFVLKLEIPRTAEDGPYYFSIIKPVIDSNDSLFGHNFSVQLTYNDVMGYVEA